VLLFCFGSFDWLDHTAADGHLSYVRLSAELYLYRHVSFVDPARFLFLFHRATFMIFACACFGAYLWSTYVVPETAGVSLEEMDEVFGSEVGQEDKKRKFEVRIVQQRDASLSYSVLAGTPTRPA